DACYRKGVGDGEENCLEVRVQQRNSSKTWEEGLPFGLKGKSNISLTGECKPLFLGLEQEDGLSLRLNLEKTWNQRAPRLECCRALPFSFRRNITRKVKSEDEDNIKNTFLDGRSHLTLGIWDGRRRTHHVYWVEFTKLRRDKGNIQERWGEE
ncbi:hypothetical protein A2U01_0040880, partial [Trifolium medium]|nr:hypothetical protein [Trifolium medium]